MISIFGNIALSLPFDLDLFLDCDLSLSCSSIRSKGRYLGGAGVKWRSSHLHNPSFVLKVVMAGNCGTVFSFSISGDSSGNKLGQRLQHAYIIVNIVSNSGYLYDNIRYVFFLVISSWYDKMLKYEEIYNIS